MIMCESGCGMGLGFVIFFNIVVEYDGYLMVENVFDGGVIFKVDLLFYGSMV